MVTPEEARKMRDEEISIELKKLREKIFTLRSQTVTDKVEDTSQFAKLRRDVARLMTERHARQLAKA
ncbi:MAG: 50S ribosomal protein L29 [Planctomycetota bacterium]|nr:50S ribosomal protein L29 [Planctomycetota bacterium]